jgi:hypothetical protein
MNAGISKKANKTIDCFRKTIEDVISRKSKFNISNQKCTSWNWVISRISSGYPLVEERDLQKVLYRKSMYLTDSGHTNSVSFHDFLYSLVIVNNCVNEWFEICQEIVANNNWFLPESIFGEINSTEELKEFAIKHPYCWIPGDEK